MTDTHATVPFLFTHKTLVGGWTAFVPAAALDDDALAATMRITEVDVPVSGILVELSQRRREDRREEIRVKASLEAGLAPFSPSNLVTGFSGEIEGVFIATHEALALGDLVEVLLHLPGDFGVLAAARVDWIREHGTPDAPAGVGLAFERLDAYETELLSTFASHREPLFFAA